MEDDVMRTDVRFTYHDYAALPEGAPYQLIDGELIVSPAPSLLHQRIVMRLALLLGPYIAAQKLGELLAAPVDVILSDEDTVQPDLVFVSAGRKSLMQREGIRGAPDLCIEVVSPSHRALARDVKRKLYARHGVIECWIVDPENQTIELFCLQQDPHKPVKTLRPGDRLTSALLLGLSLSVADILEA
jgi:Uma2 family endonuclease